MATKKKASTKAGPKTGSKLAAVRAKKVEMAEPNLIGADGKETARNVTNQHLDAVIGVEGKVRKGLLDPEDFDIRDMETLRKKPAETERIAHIMEAALNRHFSRGGKYAWKVGFFLPGDPATNGVGGWKVLQADMLGGLWTNEFRATVGLHEWEGSVCWAGRGRMDRHVLCVMTTKLYANLQDLHEKRVMDQFDSIEVPEGAGKMEREEEQLKVPLHPDPGASLNDTSDPTAESDGLV